MKPENDQAKEKLYAFDTGLVNEPLSDDFGSPSKDWIENYMHPPMHYHTREDILSYQTKWAEGSFKGSLGYAASAGVNKSARVSYWQKMPIFKRANEDFNDFGSVIYFKWGIGFFPSQTTPTSGSGGFVSDGTNGWSVRDQAYVAGLEGLLGSPEEGNALLESYIYHSDMSSFGDTGQSFGMPRFYTEISSDDWVFVEKLVSMNLVGVKDGRVMTWINGVLVEDIQGISFTNNPDYLSINRISFTNYHGGIIPAPSLAHSYISDPRYQLCADYAVDSPASNYSRLSAEKPYIASFRR